MAWGQGDSRDFVGTAQGQWGQRGHWGHDGTMGTLGTQHGNGIGTLGTQRGCGTGTVRTHWGTPRTWHGADIAWGHQGTPPGDTGFGDSQRGFGGQQGDSAVQGRSAGFGVNPAHLGAPSRIWGKFNKLQGTSAGLWGESSLFGDTQKDYGVKTENFG